MINPGTRGGRIAAWLLSSAWVVVALAMAEPVVDRILQRGFRGLPRVAGGLPGWVLPALLAYAAVVLVAVAVLLRRLPPVPPGPLVEWHTRALRIGGIVLLLAGAGNLAHSLGPPGWFPPGHPDGVAVTASRLLGAFVFGATGALLLAASLARRRGWRAAASLTLASNLVLGAFVPAGTFLLLLWWFAVRPHERPAPA